jgi:hypothetical protein
MCAAVGDADPNGRSRCLWIVLLRYWSICCLHWWSCVFRDWIKVIFGVTTLDNFFLIVWLTPSNADVVCCANVIKCFPKGKNQRFLWIRIFFMRNTSKTAELDATCFRWEWLQCFNQSRSSFSTSWYSVSVSTVEILTSTRPAHQHNAPTLTHWDPILIVSAHESDATK